MEPEEKFEEIRNFRRVRVPHKRRNLGTPDPEVRATRKQDGSRESLATRLRVWKGRSTLRYSVA
jgi:hypothetical protein